MTDNEIIKASLCHESWSDGCDSCPLTMGKACGMVLARGALDLINRQKAEIKALQMDTSQLQSDVVNANMNLNHAQAELDRFTAMVDAAEDYLHPLPFKNAFDEEIAKAKAEAIKEFAERLKRCILERDDATIDSIVKEMTCERMKTNGKL